MNARSAGHLAMDTVWEAEATGIQWLQNLGEWLALPLTAITQLGSQTLVIALLALIFWCVHADTGARLFVAVITSGVLNFFLKTVLYGSRPYWYSAQVSGFSTESSFGMPSGHAQTATVLYGFLGVRAGRRPWLWGAVALVALICFSRIYLGVHFFSDVVVGVLLGLALLWVALRHEESLLRRWRGLAMSRAVSYALAASLVPCVLASVWQLGVRGDWTVPGDVWIGATSKDPAGSTLIGLFLVAGALFGGVVGLTLLAERGWYSAEGTLLQRASRFGLGISVVIVVRALEEVLFDGLTGLAAAVVTYLVYAGVAFWATCVAPRMFLSSGLAQLPTPVEKAPDNTDKP